MTADPPGLAEPGTDEPDPVYTAVEEWVIDYFLPMFRRAANLARRVATRATQRN